MDKEWLVLEVRLAKKARVKSLEQFKEKVVKGLTKGNTFLYHNEVNAEELEEQSRKRALDMVTQAINTYPELIPWK